MNPSARGGTFFRTMVLMGSSVAVGCGGTAELVPGGGGSGGTGGTPNSGGTGGGGQATGGAGTGGATTGGTGGLALDPGSGGSSGGQQGFGGAFPTDCPTTQLSCPTQSSSTCSTSDSGYLVLPGNCECDSDRPQSLADCDPGEQFVCLAASEDAFGDPLNPLVPYNCECVTGDADSYCSDLCSARSTNPGLAQCTPPDEDSEDLQAFLCGCAVTILK